jgi:hypothetical protein
VTSAELPLAVATTGPRRPGRLPGWFQWRVLFGSLGAGFFLGALLVAVAWTAFGAEQTSPPRDVQLTIPAGTASLIAAGKPSAIPSQIQLTQGDRLILANEDAVTHSVGGWSVNAGQSLTILADSPIASVFACTIHKSGSLAIIVTPRPGLVDGILITILVSVPIGLVLFAGASVFRNLDMGPEEA